MSIQILLFHLDNEVGTAWWLIETLEFSITFTLHRGQGLVHAIKSPYRTCLKQAVDVSFVLKSFSRAHSHKIIHLCGPFCPKKKHSALVFNGDKSPLSLIKTKCIFTIVSGPTASKCNIVPGCYYTVTVFLLHLCVYKSVTGTNQSIKSLILLFLCLWKRQVSVQCLCW